jgi:hypothetical protein
VHKISTNQQLLTRLHKNQRWIGENGTHSIRFITIRINHLFTVKHVHMTGKYGILVRLVLFPSLPYTEILCNHNLSINTMSYTNCRRWMQSYRMWSVEWPGRAHVFGCGSGLRCLRQCLQVVGKAVTQSIQLARVAAD